MLPALLAYLALTVLAGAVVYVVISFVFAFWFAPRFLFWRKVLSAPYAGLPAPRGLLRAALWEVPVAAVVFVTMPLGYLLPSGIKAARRLRWGGRPVILVHGYGCSPSCWLAFQGMLRRRGVRGPMVRFGYNWLACVEPSARKLARQIAVVRETSGWDKVDLLAHSWGGIVSRWYIEKLAGAPNVHRLVMLATPNRGTWSAFYAIGCPGTQLGVGSEVTTSLGPPSPEVPSALCWSACDNIATPAPLALPAESGPGADERLARDLELPALGHLSQLWSPRCADYASAVLRTGSAPESI